MQTPDGDAVDCVPRRLQPAFDHPLLQNHILQEFPSGVPDYLLAMAGSRTAARNRSLQNWNEKDDCPPGTIPIIRHKVPAIRKSMKHRHSLQRSLQAVDSTKSKASAPENTFDYMNSSLLAPGAHPEHHEYALATYQKTPIFGGYGVLNVWKPYLEFESEMSVAQMWLLAGKSQGTDMNSIEVGWQVNPRQFGNDFRTRFFIYWTSDYYTKTGCYNLQCAGFVQVNRKFLLGGVISPISTYNGPQFDLNAILVFQDTISKNWWLVFEGVFVGYWPANIFTHLASHADYLQWGGEIVDIRANGQHTATHMGSGHFPNEGFNKSCFAHSIKVVREPFQFVDVPLRDLNLFVSNPACYDIHKEQAGSNWGSTIFFGGPGRGPRCR